jgi:thiamine-monophosphate kinase
MAAEHEVSLAGGDTCASARGFVVNVTLMGEQRPDRVITRSGAREGDLIMVSGTLGDSSLGLELLQNGVRDGFAVGRHLDPTPRVREGRRLADMMLPTAMIDISDGLLADLGHILEQSGRGAVIELEKLPLSACMSDYLRDHCPGGYRFPLSGGEDYELLFTLPPERKEIVTGLFAGLGTRITKIGRITGSGLEVISPDGAPFPLAAKGYNHFGSNGG